MTNSMTGDGADQESGIALPRSVVRVLDLFEVILAERSCNLTTAAKAVDLTPTTALRYLRALEARGYIDRDEAGDFFAGPTILRIAAALGSSSMVDRLVTTTQPHLDRLSVECGESAYLAMADGRVATYVATAESHRAIRHVGWVGQDVPLEGSALGAALARPGTIRTRTGAVEPDITAISLALQATGTLGVAISIVGPKHRFKPPERKRHEVALTHMVGRLEQELRLSGEDLAS